MNVLSPAIEEAWKVAVPFQVEDAEFAIKYDSSVMGHKTGLGKTFMAMLAWSRWKGANKALILGTLGSMATWDRLLQKWGGVKPRFVQGISDPGWDEFITCRSGVFMCTYQSFLWNMKKVLRGKPHIDVLINDELHKVMRTRNATWKAIKRLDFDHYLGLSATWASRGPQDIYPVMNLVNHRTFSSYWRWVQTWCYVERVEGMGTQIWGVRNEANLQKMLWERYYRMRAWRDVGNQFRTGSNNQDEPVIRRPEVVPMGKQQAKLIQDLDRDMMVMLGNEMVVTPNSLALLTRKLQMAVSPKILLPSAEYGYPVEWLANKIADDPHAVVFCPFREGLDVVKQKLIDDGYPENRIFIIRGGMKPDDLNKAVDLWKKNQGVALVTISFAQSFPLDTTDNAYMLGFMWDPNDNYQAEGRLRRFDTILQTPCNVSYIVPEGSDYHQVMEVLDGKVMSTHGYMMGRMQGGKVISIRDIPLMEEKDDTADTDNDE